jgi:hypothetical protein
MRYALVSLYTFFCSLLCFAGTGQTKEAMNRPQLQFHQLQDNAPKFSLLEPMAFFDINQVVAMRNAIIEADISPQEKSQQIEDAYKAGQYLLETTRDFELLISPSPERVVRVANDAFIKANLDRYFALSPSFEQIVELDKAIFTVDMALEIKKRGLPLCTSAQNFLSLVQPNLHDGKPRGKQIYRSEILIFITKNLEYFNKLNPTIDEVRELKRYILTLDDNHKSVQNAIADIHDAFFDVFSGQDRTKLLFDESKVAASAEDLTSIKSDSLLALTHRYSHVKPMLMNIVLLVKSSNNYLLLVKNHLDVLNDLNGGVLHFIRATLPVFSDLKPSINQVMQVHQFVIHSTEKEEGKVATLIKLKEQFLKRFQGADLIRLLDYGVEKPSDIYVRQLSALKTLYDIEF